MWPVTRQANEPAPFAQMLIRSKLQTLSGEFSPPGALSLVGYVSATDFYSNILLKEYSLQAIFEHDLGS
jgi:hypothetical protein